MHSRYNIKFADIHFKNFCIKLFQRRFFSFFSLTNRTEQSFSIHPYADAICCKIFAVLHNYPRNIFSLPILRCLKAINSGPSDSEILIHTVYSNEVTEGKYFQEKGTRREYFSRKKKEKKKKRIVD